MAWDALHAPAITLLERFRARGLMLAAAESCTGGLVMAALTEVPGSSDVVERGFVTYSNEAKAELLGVDPALIDAHGAVSEEVAVAMARGALARSRADIAVSVTGVAGPGGGSPAKPVGTVHFALAARDNDDVVHRLRFFGDRGRAQVRIASVLNSFELLDAAAGRFPAR